MGGVRVCEWVEYRWVNILLRCTRFKYLKLSSIR